LRSLSWGLLALSFLALLAGLYIWNSNVRLLSTLALQIALNNWPETMPNLKNGPDSSSPSPESLTLAVKRLADASRINGKRVAILCLIWLSLAGVSLWTEVRGSNLYTFYDAQVEQTDAFKYFLTLPDTTKIRVVVCDDYAHPPMFTTGMMLSKVIFADEGSCWSVNPNKHAGYFIRRDDRGVPVLMTRRMQP
jgi:hypothetical protein